MLGQVAYGFQLFNGLVVVIARGQTLGLGHDLLALRFQLLRLGQGSIQLALLILLFNSPPVDHIGQRSDDKGQNQNEGHADQNGRQINLLENLTLGLSPAAPGIVRIHRFFHQFLVKHRRKVQVIEFPKEIGHLQLRKLQLLFGLLGGILFLAVLRVLALIFLVVNRILGYTLVIFAGVAVIYFLGLIVAPVLGRRLAEISVLRPFVFLRLDRSLGLLRDLRGGAHIQKVIQISVRVKAAAGTAAGENFRIGVIVIGVLLAVGVVVKAVSLVKVKINIEILIGHWSSLPSWYSHRYCTIVY